MTLTEAPDTEANPTYAMCWPFIEKARSAMEACNDNLSSSENEENDALLTASLRLFAEHGLSAARKAHQNAEFCFHNGDRAAFHWWKQICSMLDRRMAMTLCENTLDRTSL